MRGENPLIFLFILPIDRYKKMRYNGRFSAPATVNAAGIFIITQASKFVKRKIKQKFDLFFSRFGIDKANCFCYTIIRKNERRNKT